MGAVAVFGWRNHFGRINFLTKSLAVKLPVGGLGVKRTGHVAAGETGGAGYKIFMDVRIASSAGAAM